MARTKASDPPITDAFWLKDPFNSIKPSELDSLGIDPSDIPPGTFPALKHPSQLPSRFGGNAYGVGLFELYDRLGSEEISILQSVSTEDPEQIGRHHKEINRIYSKMGLLIRFSSLGKAYYLIPDQFVSSSLAEIRNKAGEIGKIIDHHRKKYLKESHKIGVMAGMDDPIITDLVLRFKEHEFIIIDSIEKLRSSGETLDLVILSRDIYSIILTDCLRSRNGAALGRKGVEAYAIYMLRKIYQILKPEGEIFMIAHHIPLKTDETVKITFKSIQEEKNFLIFTHVFKTRKRYRSKGRSLYINIYDFQRYLSGFYVEKEILDRLLGSKELDKIQPEEIDNLPYLDFSLNEKPIYDQKKFWPKVLSVFFKEIFFKPVIPEEISTDWSRRFSTSGYPPEYLVAYLGQKRTPRTTIDELKKDVSETRLAGCPLPLLADYRDSFDYVIRTLHVLSRIKNRSYAALSEVHMERLRQPFENKKRRYSAFNDVMKLLSKIQRLERVRRYLNPDLIEGPKTSVLGNLEILPFFGFGYGEIKEIYLIMVGHTPMGRILSGKMNEKTLKPISDLARTYEPQQALNLLRYCRLMSMAETVASRKADMNQEQLAELFDLFESMVKVVTIREMDWDRLMDERISSMGGVHNKIIRKILKMMNHFGYLNNWLDLGRKGEMEKESLADYDEGELWKIENVIRLVRTIDELEDRYLRDYPLRLPVFYRKFLNIEFHGTGQLFERMDSHLVFILLWIAVNVVRGEAVNFNPVLASSDTSEVENRLRKVEEEARAINVNYLDLMGLNQFSEQLYIHKSAFILGTGFQLVVNRETRALDVHYIDMEENIRRLEVLSRKYEKFRIEEIPLEDLKEVDTLFSQLESFYQSHLRMIQQGDPEIGLPSRQKEWFNKARILREGFRRHLRKIVFRPESVYSDLSIMHRHCRNLLGFVLPEFAAFKDLKPAGRSYVRTPLSDNILSSTKRIQALVRQDRYSFQDVRLLHKLAQREFGPMDAGIVGVSDYQIDELESMVTELGKNRDLFNALVKSFIFRDLGLIPELRRKYKDRISLVDHAAAGAEFLEMEGIPAKYEIGPREGEYLRFLIRHHDFIHHMIRGEFSLYAVRGIIGTGDKELFDAFFLSSFVMFSAMREDLVFEDLAARLFRIKEVCHRAITGEMSLEDHLLRLYENRGRLFHALESCLKKGVSDKTPPSDYLELWKEDESDGDKYLESGRMIYGMERIFRLRGIRYVEFSELANFMINIPLKYIYRKKRYFGVGYATFERELFEALRIYRRLQAMPEPIRHVLLERMVEDEIRVFGFEHVSAFMSYDNLLKLILIALLGAGRLEPGPDPVCLDFLGMAESIDRRYEAVNDWLNGISLESVWEDKEDLGRFFRARVGIQLRKDEGHRVLSIDFADRINVPQKISYMKGIDDIEQLKNYYHHSLKALRAIPFYTDDYELELEKGFENRLMEITDLILANAKRQMDLLKDFQEVHNLVSDLSERSLDIGFSGEQRHRLIDMYELKKDALKREKLDEIGRRLEVITDVDELRDYWDTTKWYLWSNRHYLGKEFENLVARRFDASMARLKGIS